MTNHPDLEALSAGIDGEDDAGAVAAHLSTCGDCRGRLEELHRARRAVAAPVTPPAADVRERMLAAALTSAQEPVSASAPAAAAPAGPTAPGPAPVVALPERDRRRWWAVGGGVAAAVMALVVGAAGLVGRGADSNDETALSQGPPPAAESAVDSAAGGDATAGLAPPAGPGVAPPAGPGVVELGDVPDVATLRTRLPASRTANAVRADAQSPSSPREIGTRVCEEQARTARPDVATLVYVATARFAGTPAVVLGFGATPGSPPSTVLVLAEAGCRLLAETVVP